MGSSASVNRTADLNTVNGNIQDVCDAFLTKEDNARLDKLRNDLILYKDIREAFADFIVWRAEDCPEEVVDTILNIDEKYMNHLLLSDSMDNLRESDTDLILYYFHVFAKSPVYDEVFAKEVEPTITPLSTASMDETSFRESARPFVPDLTRLSESTIVV